MHLVLKGQRYQPPYRLSYTRRAIVPALSSSMHSASPSRSNTRRAPVADPGDSELPGEPACEQGDTRRHDRDGNA